MECKIISIDPGLSGAVAVMVGGEIVELHDMPTCVVDGLKTADGSALAAILAQHLDAACVVVERPISTGIGRVSMLAQGRNVGIVWGVCMALGLSLKTLDPLRWKRKLGLTKADIPADFPGDHKDWARQRAAELWPEWEGHFARVRDDGRAEACLIGYASKEIATTPAVAAE